MIIELFITYDKAKGRINGRRVWLKDRSHPNNIKVPELYPNGGKCLVCGSKLLSRADDQNDSVIKKTS